MQRRTLADHHVFPIGLGGMPMSISGRPDRATSIQVIHAALDAGMELIDTADVYCVDHDDIGHNERLVAEALASWGGDRSRVVVATKGGLERPGGDWTLNGKPDHLKQACDASLRALGVERIDVYQLHAVDDDVPLADSVGALRDLKDAGKIAHVALSNVRVPEIEEARRIVEIVSVQNRCNPHDTRSFDEGVVAYCEANGIAFLPYSPVGGGRGKTSLARDPDLVAVGAEVQATPFEVALAWLLAKSPVMLPIPGASKVRNAVSSARAASVVLSETQLARLDAAFL